jgi:cytidine deaminase
LNYCTFRKKTGMKQKEIRIWYEEYSSSEELPEDLKQLVESAREVSSKAWAPYSGFCVGAAVRLANGMVFTGNNQENAAYPSGLCAERTALFYSNANYPEVPVVAIAISARTDHRITNEPVSPCGSCRQVMMETETRFKQPINIILDGQSSIRIFLGIESLLPMSFKPESLKG